jgi:hypothetical protein
MKPQSSCLDAAALLAVAEGRGDAAQVAHVSACAACQTVVADYRTLHEVLSRLYRADCANTATLADLACDMLLPAERAAATAHVAICSHCTAELEELLTDWREPASIIPPQPSPLGRLTAVIAQLIAPSGNGRTAGAVRGSKQAATSELLYVTEETQLTLWTEAGTDGCSLCGQVTSVAHAPADLDGSRVDMMRIGMTVAAAAIDIDGAFTVAGLARGIYTLCLNLPDHTIVIPALSLP